MSDQYPKPLLRSTMASVLLDFVRGFAAILVLLEHWRNMLFVDYHQLAYKTSWPILLPYLFTSSGHQAVIIFFILSGYLISRSVVKSIVTNRWQWRIYLIHRIVRLWVVLLPGLLLGALWDFLGTHFGMAPALYGGQVDNHLTSDICRTLTMHVFLGNILFLQTVLVPIFGSNQALWSLANEFWYYILFPLGLLACRSATSWKLRLAYILSFGLVAWFIRGNILWLFPIWLAGALLSRLRPPKCSPRIRVVVAVIYFPLIFIFSKIKLPSDLVGDYIFALFTTFFLWVMLSATTVADEDSILARVSRGTSNISYSLYIVHMPFCLFLTALIAGDRRWQPDITHVAKGAGILALTMGYTYFFALKTEFRTDLIRRWVERKAIHHRTSES